MGEHKSVYSIVGKRTEESGSANVRGAVAHGGIRDLSDLISDVKLTKVNGRVEDGGHSFSEGSVVLWQHRHGLGVGRRRVEDGLTPLGAPGI